MQSRPSVSVIIPTYNREQVLIQTLTELLNLSCRAWEILVIDQTKEHSKQVNDKLSALNTSGDIIWVRLSEPSIPNAMNLGAVKANGEIILFLDDDIQITSDLVFEHASEYAEPKVGAVAGGVIQSWEAPLTVNQPSYLNNQRADPDAFQFNSSVKMEISRFMGGNVSFRRSSFLQTGGFDRNFSKVAYRFEAEFAERFISAGNTIVFNPEASIKHLKTETGGTRTFGDHRKTISPAHSVGRYYYMLVVANQKNRWLKFICSPFISCATKFHASHPWWIPITMIAEFSGMIWAVYLKLKGQQLINQL